MQDPLEPPPSFLIAGTVRNAAKTLSSDVERLARALSPWGVPEWLVIESDSNDGTVPMLTSMAKSIPAFEFVSLGDVRHRLPLRTERIAFCRNLYVERIREKLSRKSIDYVVVADFDGVNSHISAAAVQSCFGRSDWDVCTANQLGPYYDIFALRHPVWCPTDCCEERRWLRQVGVSPLASIKTAIYSKMITIPPEAEWIAVDSAFGGFAIYRAEMFVRGRYAGIGENGAEVCEHVAFHRDLRKAGARIFINPGLINAHLTDHTRNLTIWGRTMESLHYGLRSVTLKVLGPALFEKVRHLGRSGGAP